MSELRGLKEEKETDVYEGIMIYVKGRDCETVSSVIHSKYSLTGIGIWSQVVNKTKSWYGGSPRLE